MLDPELVNLLRSQVAHLVLSSASAAIDAASLVFAQSIVDDAAWSYLKVCATVDPAAWEGQIDDRKVGVKDLKAKSYEDIRAELIELGSSRLVANHSSQNRPHVPSSAPAEGFRAAQQLRSHDRSEIEKIDGQRHNMIHENGFGTPLPTLEEDLEYLKKTAWFLMGLVNKKHGLMIGMRRVVFRLQTVTPQEAPPPES